MNLDVVMTDPPSCRDRPVLEPQEDAGPGSDYQKISIAVFCGLTDGSANVLALNSQAFEFNPKAAGLLRGSLK